MAVTTLSKAKIESFVGDVLPLQLLSEADLSHEPIEWNSDPEKVSIRSFAGDSPPKRQNSGTA